MASTEQSGSEPLQSTDFGANEWLAEEMYERYQQDPESVDAAWARVFQGNGYRPDSASATTQEDAPAKPAVSKADAATSEATDSPSPSDAAGQSAAGERPGDQPNETAHPVSIDLGVAPELPREIPDAPRSRGKADEHRKRELTEHRAESTTTKLRGPASRVVTNMQTSLTVPTATSVRAVPAKLMIDNRIVINSNLARHRGGKVSFTHIIGYAMVEALAEMPDMNYSYSDVDGKPSIVDPGAVNLGIAIDLPRPDGTRQLVVPAVKNCDRMDFGEFWAAYEDVVRRARTGKLVVDDFAGVTITLTNPGTIGTVHSVPRLMKGQGAIIGVGAMEYPAEYAGASEETIARMAVSKVMTLTSTYDHRIIQGAVSGAYLALIHKKLLGEDGFFDRIFRSLRIPYEPVRWMKDSDFAGGDQVDKIARVVELVHAYRVRGHLMADTDPLEYKQRHHHDLDIQSYGLTLWDLEREFPTGDLGAGNLPPVMKLRHILGVVRDTYCRTVGIEYMQIQEHDQRSWIQKHFEKKHEKPASEEQLRILRRLNAAEAFETFLQTKFVGQKRFSLEGGEASIPLLDAILTKSAQQGILQVCIGMPHRGRLNVLANIAGKSYAQIFREFEGAQDPRSVQGSGDVKYHLGTEGEFRAHSGETTKVYLAANPSHLEAVNPVLEGIVRAKQDRVNLGGSSFPVLPILMHGDAAFAGQGIVQETLQMSQLRGYRTGGTIHVIVNNQVGFTTAPTASRSSVYATDIARMIQAPIFHVNGDDPEAVVRVSELAFEFRQKFAEDVVIDMICYRRRGHNEGDDPSMTNPLMYSLIEAKRSVRKVYVESLVGRGDITEEEAASALKDYQQQLERVFTETKEAQRPDAHVSGTLGKVASQKRGADEPSMASDQTSISREMLKRIGDVMVSPLEGFTVHPKLRQMLEKRSQMVTQGGIDWGFAELIAIGSLLAEGTPVRLSGQDSRRGTFVQRHATLIDRETGEEWTPLLYLGEGQARLWAYDSPLSEYGVLGFEYGYSVERADALVLWEAQFGDFANGAQTIIDEFISSSEQKWGQNSSVTMLLPHGFEGQGPDHSSARIERYMNMCAQSNMTVAAPSTPASYFHLLRRQAYGRPRRPLVVFTPKSMLRNKRAISGPDDFMNGTFRAVIGEERLSEEQIGSVDRVLLCSGKLYWDLLTKREELGDSRTAIIRAEQLYPVFKGEWLQALAPYGSDVDVVWTQEEPRNQGAWPFMGLNLPTVVDRPIRCVSRPASASPATGSSKRHAETQSELVEQAFAR